MSLQTSASAADPLTINEIKAEFAGPTPSKLTDYYKGGGYVAAHGNNSAIPATGRINILNFLGADIDFETNITYASGSYSSMTQSQVGYSKSINGAYTLATVTETLFFGSYLLQLNFTGDVRGSWFTSITFNGISKNRTAATVPTGSYASPFTTWTFGNTSTWGIIGFTGSRNLTLVL